MELTSTAKNMSLEEVMEATHTALKEKYGKLRRNLDQMSEEQKKHFEVPLEILRCEVKKLASDYISLAIKKHLPMSKEAETTFIENNPHIGRVAFQYVRSEDWDGLDEFLKKKHQELCNYYFNITLGEMEKEEADSHGSLAKAG